MAAGDPKRWVEVRCTAPHPEREGELCNRRQPDLREGGESKGVCKRCGRLLYMTVRNGQPDVQVLAEHKPKARSVGYMRIFEHQTRAHLH